MFKTSIIIPTYNEIINIKLLIKEIFNQISNVNLIVVDDNSPDLTWKLVENLSKKNKKIYLIKNRKKSGIGNAYKKGFDLALKIKSEVIIQMDADLSHDPSYLKGMIKLIEGNDLVIGSRYVSGINVVNWPMRRVLLSYLANKYTSFVTGIRINDFTSGFKVFRRKVIEKINLTNVISDGYSFQIEMNYIVKKLGFKITEFPIIFKDRVNGESKLDKNIIFEAFLNVIKLRFKNY